MKHLLKITQNAFLCLSTLILAVIVGLAFTRLLQLPSQIDMMRLSEDFHLALSNRDRAALEEIMADEFEETGVSRFVRTPKVIRKAAAIHFATDNGADVDVRTQFLYPLSLLSPDPDSLTFVRTINYEIHQGGSASVEFLVTYEFERSGDEMRIKAIRRRL